LRCRCIYLRSSYLDEIAADGFYREAESPDFLHYCLNH